MNKNLDYMWNPGPRKIYQTETVTSGLCYIEELIFLENSIV